MQQVLCPIVVGRDDELEALASALEVAAASRGGALFLLGEAGIGKSRLAREAEALAERRGCTVLVGRAVDSASPVPFRPLAEALMSAVRQYGLPERSELGPFRGALGRLLPEWRGVVEPSGDDSILVLGEAVLRLLRSLDGGDGCLLVLEDLHWADPSTVAVVEYLADNARSERLLLLVTARTGELTSVEQLARSLQARGSASLLRLRRLGAADVERMARAALDTSGLSEDVQQLLHSWADGIPLLIEDLLAGLMGSGTLVRRDAGWILDGPARPVVPAGFGEGVQQRLARLGPNARQVLAAAALLQGRFDWALLPSITGFPESEVLEQLRLAVATQLVVTDGAGFSFRHALTRDAVLAALLPPERAELARRAVQAVRDAHPDLEGSWCELAAELAEAAGDHSSSSRLLLHAARRALSRGALATAEDELERSRRLARDDPVLAAQAEEDLIEVLSLMGEADRALELGAHLLDNLAAVNASGSRQADIHLRLAQAAAAATRWEQAQRHLARARTLAGNGDVARLLAQVDAQAAEVALGVRQPDEAAALAQNALDRAQSSGLPDVACTALEVLGRCARMRDLEEARIAFERAASLAASHDLTVWRIRALHELGTIDLLSVNGFERLVEARELAERAGALALAATLDIQLASAYYGAFEPERVVEVAERAGEAARRFRLDRVLPMALLWQAAGHAQRGERHAMEAGISAALALAGDDPDASAMAWGWCRAMCSVVQDDRRSVKIQLDQAAGCLRQSPAMNPWGFRGLWALLSMLANGGGAIACDEVRQAGATVYWMNRGYLALARAVAAGRVGDVETAGAAFAEGDETLAVSQWFRHHARYLVAEAAAASGWGDPHAWLREGAIFFGERGLDRLASACRSLLHRIGGPLPRRGRGDSTVPPRLRALGVTSREMDVLRLVAERLGNQEIGARLYLSPRTVEKHVASLIAKTGVRDRLELVTVAGTCRNLGDAAR